MALAIVGLTLGAIGRKPERVQTINGPAVLLVKGGLQRLAVGWLQIFDCFAHEAADDEGGAG